MQVGDLVAGRYRLVGVVGRGGMGVVHEAYDEVLDRPVALKVLQPLADPEFTVRFHREATVLARVRSPHILAIYDHGSFEGHPFLVTELVSDGDLRGWIRQHGPLPPTTAVRLAEQLCEALSDAHDLGVIHRDVKPANVLLWNRRDGLWAYLADFGIAREGSDALTRSGALVGSVAYMAPERHLGEEADARADLYSVGCVLWSMLEGTAPYSGTDFQVMDAHLHQPVPPLSDEVAGRDLITPVLHRFLAKQPGERFQTADEGREALAALAARLRIVTGAGEAVAVRPPSDEPEETVRRPASPAPEPVEPADDTVLRSSAESAPPPVEPVEPADDTVLRSYAGPAAAATPPPERPGTGRRRLVVLGVVAAALVVVLGVAAAVLAAGGDDGDEPADAGSSLPASTPPTTAPRPDPPPAPHVEHGPAYRGVRFTVATVPQAELEVRRGGRWVALADRSFTQPTEEGGERTCATVRAVTTTGDVAGDSTKACDRAEPATIRWTRTSLPCSTPTGLPCAYYDVHVAGFRSGARLPVSLSTAGGQVLCGTDCLRPLPVGPDGRGTADGSLRRDGRPAAFLVTIATDGRPTTFVLRVGDRSIRTRQPTH